MFIDKAIEILTIYKADGEAACSEDLDNAIQLGIEALKAIDAWRVDFDDNLLISLPGETED